MGASVAHQMFADAHHASVTGGRLRVVANKHLDHPQALRRIVGPCRVVAINRKLVILDALRQRGCGHTRTERGASDVFSGAYARRALAERKQPRRGSP